MAKDRMIDSQDWWAEDMAWQDDWPVKDVVHENAWVLLQEVRNQHK